MGELKIVQNADWNLEIGALSVLSSKHKENTPALLFDRIKDYPAGDPNPRRLLRELAPFRSSMYAGLSKWMGNFPPAAEIDAEYQKSLMEKWRKELFN